MSARRTRSRFGLVILGAILIVVGGFYALTNLAGIALEWDMVWPLFVVGLGVVFLARAVVPSDSSEPNT